MKFPGYNKSAINAFRIIIGGEGPWQKVPTCVTVVTTYDTWLSKSYLTYGVSVNSPLILRWSFVHPSINLLNLEGSITV